MNEIVSINDIVVSIAEIRNLRKGFITNFFLDYFKHQVWINHGVFYTEKIGDTLFLIKKNDDFWNVFYASTSQEELKSAFLKFKESHHDIIIMVDIVGRKNDCEQMVSSLKEILPYEYCGLVRMSRFASLDYEPSENISYVKKGQVDEIYSLLNTYFDKRTEQIPYREELEDCAEKNHILIYKVENKIAGFVVFEMSKMSLYLRYWFVHPDFREKGIGSKLFKQFFYEGRETKRQQLWVICTNENAIKRYVHYGFKDENLFDFVITNKNIKYEGENNKNIK
jgi:ribosomal protein S18 acetylase RimI-like enzyme